MIYTDSVIARDIMRWKHKGETFFEVNAQEFDTRRCEPSNGDAHYRYWSPSTNLADAFEMEETIYNNGLAVIYINYLRMIVWKDINSTSTRDWYDYYLITHATAEQRARSALRLIGE